MRFGYSSIQLSLPFSSLLFGSLSRSAEVPVPDRGVAFGMKAAGASFLTRFKIRGGGVEGRRDGLLSVIRARASQHVGSILLSFALALSVASSSTQGLSAFVWDYFKTFSAILNGKKGGGRASVFIAIYLSDTGENSPLLYRCLGCMLFYIHASNYILRIFLKNMAHSVQWES